MSAGLMLSLATLFTRVGAYEGAQVGTKNRSNWWGAIAPVVPQALGLDSSLASWRLFYSIVLIICYLLLIRIRRVFRQNPLSIQNFLYLFFVYLAPIYILLNGRDGLLFFLLFVAIISSVTLEKTSKRGEKPMRIRNIRRAFRISWVSLLIAFAALFKLALLPVVLAVFWACLYLLGILRIDIRIIMIVGMIFLSIVMNEKMERFSNLSQSFPEQQVMVYDLAMAYCWSSNEQVRGLAERGISPIRNENRESRIVCGSLTPFGWDNLRFPFITWFADSPLRTIQPTELMIYKDVRKTWINLVTLKTKYWLEIKTNTLGQVLFMSNSLSTFTPSESNDGNAILSTIMRVASKPAQVLDQFRIFSLGATLFWMTLIAFYRRQFSIYPLILCVIGILNNLIVYVANNGRYTMSTVLSSIILLILIPLRTSPKSDL